MEKTIYIPGDLVMTNGIPIGTKKGIVYQVTESNADKSAKVKDGNAFTELKGSVTLSNLKGKTIKDDGFLFCDSGAWVKDIVPIPLTPSILEKNGWKKDDYDLYRLPTKLDCDRNFVGYEIDKTLEEYHESLSATQIACSRTIASSRILQHNRFVADREINGKDLKYFNKHLGCKVMTKQEQDIKL